MWTWIKGFYGSYKVSTKGHVKSVDRIVIRGNVQQPLKERIIKHGVNPKTGYHNVTIQFGGTKRCDYVHRLVAETFIPNPKNLPEVNHKDLNKGNNTVENLEWASHCGNKTHAVRNGVKFNPNPKRGEDAGPSILTWKIVRTIRKLYATKKYTQKTIAIKFGVTQPNIYYIVNNKTWIE